MSRLRPAVPASPRAPRATPAAAPAHAEWVLDAARAITAAIHPAPAHGRQRGGVLASPRTARPRAPRAISAGRWVRRAVVVAVVLVVSGLALGAGSAAAAGYRYWSYWTRGADGWTYAQAGPAGRVPGDGSVEGWRFAVSEDAADRATQPRGAADFGAICGGTPAQAGKKRVALVIDAGTAADAPGGQAPPERRTACARVPKDASSADALASVARPLRYDSAGILCAIDGYPRTGCGEQTAAKPAGDGDGGPSLGLYAGVAAVLALGGAAGWQARRRRS